MAVQFPDPSITQIFQGPNGVTYQWDEDDGKWIVKSTSVSGSYVRKEGGDSMQGPLSISAQPNMDSRESRRINTLGVFSNSDNSALRLGTTRDRVYVGHNDVSINGPIKVDEIQEKTDGNNVKVSNDLDVSGAPETDDFGEGTINLLGRRTSANVTCGKITFNNREDEDNAGIISYNTLNETGKFTINQDVKLDSGDAANPASLNFASGGQIQQGGGKRVTFKTASNGNPGSGLVEFSRPGNTARRGVAFRGNIVDPDDSTQMKEVDLLYTYTNSSGTSDAVNYEGKSDNGNNIVNYKTMEAYVKDKTSIGLQGYESINYLPLKEDLTIVEGSWSGSAGDGNLKVEDLEDVSTHVGWRPDNTGKIYIGQPLKFVHDSGVRYGRVEAVWANSNTTHLTVGDWVGDPFVAGETSTVEYQKTPFATEEYVDSHIKESVLHLGSYSYARSGDSFSTGVIRSNTSTNPANITELSIHRTNSAGIDWTKGFFDRNIKETMYVSLRKTSSDYYQGKVIGVVEITSGIKLQLEVVKSAGIFQLGQGIEVSLSYNKSEGAVALNTTSDYTVDDEGDLHFGDHLLEDIKDPESAQDAATKNYVDVKIEELENQSASSGRVIITPLEFYMNSYGQYPNDSGITGLSSGGNPIGGNDVYGYHIPWKWFEENHPELIGFIYTAAGNLINGRAASVDERTVSGNPGLSIRSSDRTSRATVTIQGWHVQVDDISEDQYTRKF